MATESEKPFWDSIGDLSKKWAGKSLEDFRSEAEKEMNGTVYEAVRPQTNGVERPRLFLAVCVTGEHELKRVESLFDFDEETPKDWKTYTVAEMLITAETMGGRCYQDLKDGSGKRVAAVFAAVGREPVEMLSRVFNLPG